MLNRRCHHRVGRLQAEFERDDGIAGNNKRADETNVLETFRFFNEIEIIAQLSQSLFESMMPHRLTLSQFTGLNHFIRVGKQKAPHGSPGHSRSPGAQADCIDAVTPKLVSIIENLGAEGLADALPQLELLRKYLDASRN